MIYVIAEKCIGCNACIKTCPVPNANRYDGSTVKVNNDRCIKCGECVKGCIHGARYYDDDLEEVLELMKTKKVSFVVAPAIKTAMDGRWRHVLKWLKDNGAHEIYDASFGADICTYLHIQYVKQNPDKKIISQPCAAIVNYAEKHKPQLIERLSPIQSPLMCTAIYVRKYLGSDDILVGLTPCIAKGDEFRNTGVIEYNVTFKRLDEYLKNKDLSLPTGYSEFEFSTARGFDGGFYPLPGGLKECLNVYAPELSVTTSEGVQKVYKDFDTYLEAPYEKLPAVYDVLSCEFGCNSGVGATKEFKMFDSYDIMVHAKNWAQKRRASERFHKKIFGALRLEDFIRTYQNRCTDTIPTEAQLDAVFRKMEKYTEADRHIDCHACGFKSYRDMARTIFAGNNTSANCMVYEKNRINRMKAQMEEQNEALSRSVKQIHASLNILENKIQPISPHAASNATTNDGIRKDMNTLSVDMASVQRRTEQITEKVRQIDEGIEQYTKILEKIQSISHQTNILAINASIEAARAGVYGKGFAVVADEVRNLAVKFADTVQEAEEYTAQILENVSGITEASDAIVNEVKGTKQSVDRTNDAVDALNSSLSLISSSVNEVSAVIEELNETAARHTESTN